MSDDDHVQCLPGRQLAERRGRAYAEYLAELGASVVVNDVNADAAVAAAAEIAVRPNVGTESHAADISEPQGGASLAATAVDTFGGLDIVVNNAGIVRDKLDALDADRRTRFSHTLAEWTATDRSEFARLLDRFAHRPELTSEIAAGVGGVRG